MARFFVPLFTLNLKLDLPVQGHKNSLFVASIIPKSLSLASSVLSGVLGFVWYLIQVTNSRKAKERGTRARSKPRWSWLQLPSRSERTLKPLTTITLFGSVLSFWASTVSTTSTTVASRILRSQIAFGGREPSSGLLAIEWTSTCLLLVLTATLAWYIEEENQCLLSYSPQECECCRGKARLHQYATWRYTSSQNDNLSHYH